MNIQYYKPKQDSLILFAKRKPKTKLRLIIGTLAILGIASFGYFKAHTHPTVALNAGSNLAPLPFGSGTLSPLTPQLQQLTTKPTDTNIDLTRNPAANSNDEIDATNIETNKSSTSLASTSSDINHEKEIKVVSIKSRDNLAKIFARNNLPAKEVEAIRKSGVDAHVLKKLQPGKKITLVVNNNRLQELSYPINSTDTLVVTRNGQKFRSMTKTRPLEVRQGVAKFTIRGGSLLAAARKAGLSNKRIAQLATIFKPNTDINKASHSGDKLSVIFQDYYLDGKKIKDGEIIAAEFMTATNTFQAIRYTDPKGNSGYYSPDGSSLDKRFLTAPVKFTKITSLFNPRRWHPILHRFRHHKGVDYAAPYGTPIKSVGNGTIALLGRKGGYGNTIIIKHDGSYSTLYGHMSKYAEGLHTGSSVKQGQIIGYVGSSGLATGPHLHFEFRVNGVHRNPLTVALPNGKAITKAYRNKFKAEAKKLLAKLSAHKETQLAANKAQKENNS